MNLTDAKLFVDSLMAAGKSAAAVAEEITNEINLNGDLESLLLYIHEKQD